MFVSSRRLGGAALTLLTILSLSACLGPPDTSAELFQDYRDRLERVLDTDFPAAGRALPVEVYPRSKALQREVAELKINLLDFLGLTGCKLNRLVGFRNSSLGKMMPASQKWLYEQHFLSLGGACLTTLEAHEEQNVELVEELRNALASKRDEIRNVAWNATWAGPEWQALMSQKEGGFDLDFQAGDWAELSLALSALADWSTQPESASLNADSLEALNRRLLTYPMVGRLLFSAEEASAEMGAIVEGLRRRLAERPLCVNGAPNERSRILQNVLVNIYSVRVQSYLAQLEKARRDWLPPLQRSYDQLQGDQSVALRSFAQRYLQEGEASLWWEFRHNAAAHAAIWTEMLAQCGLAPGSR
ncbi:DUF3080 family protein [Hahella sp. KA22]|uniref:DUF3080 domain-containing protein n=1 Tax=Hahella sp. KA22 TaxID=1628392 RepID=UPI000FDE2BF8|nr:DUF3080 domain-containing protein [Hahella sp. KA22]AZZ93634.1 DUF3080 domain-containing protein [Hahella sp. KA22]QAY57009.1 DUF3080 family protein [Hahella sp. KA22]